MNNQIFSKFSEYNLGLDLGSSFVKVFADTKGVLFFEPSVIARQKKKGKQIIAVGKKAAAIMGKEPQNIEVIEPIENGVIADFDAALCLTKYLFSLVSQTPGKWLRLLGPKVIAGVSCQATEVERRAIKAVLVKSGAREVFLIEKPMAAAVGLALPIEGSGGFLVLDIGGSTTEMAVLSLGGIVLERFLPIGGEDFNQAIINYLRLKYGMLIGRPTAQKVKEELGSVSGRAITSRLSMVVRGRDLATGLPKSIRIKKNEVMESLVPLVQKITLALREMLEETPAELTDDILKRGIYLSGGSARLAGWEDLVTEETKMPAILADKPQELVVRGCGALLADKSLLKRVKLVAGLK
ncbi:MAG: rod shape-determining protein [Candidatus Shapirobacteria bacterium]